MNKIAFVVAVAKLVAGLTFLLAACGPTSASPAPSPSTSTTQVHLEEDDPGWDCHTMGDQHC